MSEATTALSELQERVKALLLALPKCACGRLGTHNVLVHHQYDYPACQACSARCLGNSHMTVTELPYATMALELAAQLPGHEALLAHFDRAMTDAERRAAWGMPPQEPDA